MKTIKEITAAILTNGQLTAQQQKHITQECLDMVWSMAKGFQHQGDRTDNTEDLFQEGMMVLLQLSQNFQSVNGAPFLHYARNHVRGAMCKFLYDYGNSVNIPESLRDIYQQTDLEHVPASYQSTEADDEVQALQARVAAMLNGLPQMERRVLELRFGFVDGHEYTTDEIAASLHLTRGRVNQLMQRGMNVIG